MNKEIEYYTFQYKIPVYKVKPNQDFCNYYQIHKDEIIVELDKQNKDLQQRIDKAIEYIKKHRIKHLINESKEIDEFHILASPKELIEILGGKE